MEGAIGYETNGMDLLLEGIPLPVNPNVVRRSFLREIRRTGRPPLWGRTGLARIDPGIARSILRAERQRALSELASRIAESA